MKQSVVSERVLYRLGYSQTETTSPILFCLFVNDIEFALQENITCELILDQLSIILLM